MPIPNERSGAGSNAKIITWNLPEYEGEYVFKVLSKREVIALLTAIQPLSWSKRHETLPDDLNTQDTLDAWADKLRNKLMQDFNFCAEVKECIELNDDVRNALRDFLNSPGGNPLPPSELTRNLAGSTNPTCNSNILWAQCKAVIHETHLAIIDVLQKVNVLLNFTELAKALWDSIPVMGALDNASGIDGVINLMEYYKAAVQEGYEAQYTETSGGYEDELAYALFCKCSIDCNITINRITEIMRTRIAVYTSPPSFTGLVNLVETLAGINQDTTFVVDLAFLAAWEMFKISQFFFGKRSNNLLELIVRLKSDEPSNDWEAMALVFGACPNCAITNTITEGTEVI